MLLLELLYKTDYGNDFDREVRAPRLPAYLSEPSGLAGNRGRACPPACVCACTGVHACVHACVCTCLCMHVWGAPHLPPACPLTPAGGVSPQGVILCFGLCARGQVTTVLNVLHDFEERIQESERSWQMGAWRVRPLAPRPGPQGPLRTTVPSAPKPGSHCLSVRSPPPCLLSPQCQMGGCLQPRFCYRPSEGHRVGLPRTQHCRGALAPLTGCWLGMQALRPPQTHWTSWEHCPRESRGWDRGAGTLTEWPVHGETGAGPRPPMPGLWSDSLPQGGCHRLAESPLGNHLTSLMPQVLALTLDACPGSSGRLNGEYPPFHSNGECPRLLPQLLRKAECEAPARFLAASSTSSQQSRAEALCGSWTPSSMTAAGPEQVPGWGSMKERTAGLFPGVSTPTTRLQWTGAPGPGLTCSPSPVCHLRGRGEIILSPTIWMNLVVGTQRRTAE